jgi:hypothetical protein
MDISVALYMIWQDTLLIIPSNVWQQVSFRTGAQSKLYLSISFSFLLVFRCFVHRDSLGVEKGKPRDRETGILLLEKEAAGRLNSEYGLSKGVLVSGVCSLLRLATNYVQPFTYSFPRADIYHMILPNILHQLIKGCFHDHLIQWVEDYLTLTYGKATANSILSDIDKR